MCRRRTTTSLRRALLKRSKSEVLRDNANVVAAEEKCSSIIVFLRVPSLACLCAATHSCVRSFVPSSMYTVLLSWGRTVRTICGCHCVWCRPLSTCRPTMQQSSKQKFARSEALQAASGLAASGVTFTPESLMLTKDEASGGTVRRTCSRWMQRVQRQSFAGARCERECRGTIGRGGGVLPARCVTSSVANAYLK